MDVMVEESTKGTYVVKFNSLYAYIYFKLGLNF